MKPGILIVDDEAIRYAFRSFVSKEGCEVLTAKDYALAIETISSTDIL